MDDLRSVYASNEEEDVLQKKAVLDQAGYPCQIIMANSYGQVSHFDAQTGIDRLFRFNLMVGAGDEESVLALLNGDREDSPLELSPEPTPSEALGDSDGPQDIPTDGNRFFRSVLANFLLFHLARGFLLSLQIQKKPLRAVSLGLTVLVHLGYFLALGVVFSGRRPPHFEVFLMGLLTYSVVGAAVCAVDCLLSRNVVVFRFLLGFSTVWVLFLAAMFLASLHIL